MPKGRIKIGVRLQQILDEQNLKQIDFVRKAEPLLRERGLKLSPNKFNQYVNDRHGPDSDMIELFAEVAGVDPAWLSGFADTRKPAPSEGDGFSQEDVALLELIRKLDRGQKLMLIAQLETLIKAQEERR